MKFIKNKVALACILGSFVLPSAHALELSLVGALTVSKYNLSATTDIPSSSGLGLGFGGLVGHDLNALFSVETGLLYLNHEFTTNLGTTQQDFNYKYTTIPLLLRVSPLGLLSVGAGFYYGIATSATVDTTFGTSSAISADGTKSNDFGLMAGVGVRLPIIPTLLKARADILYEFGLTNLSSISGVTQYSRNFDILVGLMLDL